MSHFSSVTVEIKNEEHLRAYLKEMGYEIKNVGVVRGYNNIQQLVDFAILPRENSYPIGFRKNEKGVYEVVADWWGVKGTTEKELIVNLKTTHSNKQISKFALLNRFQKKAEVKGKQTIITLTRRV